jgi:hypothetical protein
VSAGSGSWLSATLSNLRQRPVEGPSQHVGEVWLTVADYVNE